jgi:dsDNA-specific endonuclease/ATPase MutS2
MEYNKLVELRNQIEKLSHTQQVEILRIIQNNNISFSENLSGIHINLINVNISTLNEIQRYLKYMSLQEETLNVNETQMEEFKKEFKNICVGKL